jgi:hypothetical protein
MDMDMKRAAFSQGIPEEKASRKERQQKRESRKKREEDTFPVRSLLPLKRREAMQART